ncbi:transposase [Streptomyces sp. NPDC001851]|uniref:transposase n=1 Tax=Streptomyces sp. NPDC001851 TaxID=3154529 RepID=UPI00331FDFAE
MLDAVRYVVDNRIQWANLPADFPPYRRVHAFARRWHVTGLLAELHDRLRDCASRRGASGRDGGDRGRSASSLGPPLHGPSAPGLQHTEHRRHQPPPRT